MIEHKYRIVLTADVGTFDRELTVDSEGHGWYLPCGDYVRPVISFERFPVDGISSKVNISGAGLSYLDSYIQVEENA